MHTTGIITEYNPFHNGHLYHIQKTKEQTNADYLIVVMSGDFTQRGLPALVDKYSRAKTAILHGADLVLELPVVYASHSAEFFAKGGVSLLHSLGIVDSICFGSECGDIATLSSIAKLLLEEPATYTKELKTLLKSGLSFPQARIRALSSFFPADSSAFHALQTPNNILGIEYLKALLSLESKITPHTILREGSGYHDLTLTGTLASASAIRNALQKDEDLSSLQTQLPALAFTLLEDYFHSYGPIFPDDFSSILYYKLLSKQPSGYTEFLDVSSDLSDRIVKNLAHYTSFSEFANLLKTKELTHTRITRCLIHILLDITNKETTTFLSEGISHYARILAFSQNSAPLLSKLKKHSQIPLIAKLSKAPTQLSDTGMKMLSKDIFASTLYHSVLCQKHHLPTISEYQRSPFAPTAVQ